MSTFAEGAGIFFMLVTMFALAGIVSICTLPFGRKRAMVAGLITIAVCIALDQGWKLRHLAASRSNINEQGCRSDRSPDGQYVARICRMGTYDVLRLRKLRTAELLAEKTYRHVDVPMRFYWEKDRLEYFDGDPEDLASITLPPSMVDRLLARLP
jgi:hypothetical protein